MSLYYKIVFGILAIELSFLSVLSLPLPRKPRRIVLKLFSKPFENQQFRIALKCFLGFILVLFIDSVNRARSISAELYNMSSQSNQAAGMSGYFTDRSEIQARRFYAQRNMYLCGFTLFLTFIILRTHSLVDELVLTKDKVDNLKAKKPEKGSEVDTLKKELADREEYLQTLKEKAESLRKDYESESAPAAVEGKEK